MNHIEKLIARHPELESVKADIEAAAELITNTYLQGNKVLLCGNGGSAADCEHIAGELLKGFLLPRSLEDAALPRHLRKCLQGALPAIPLPSLTAAITASLNDISPEFIFSQLLLGLAKPGDLLIAISTSGNSKNVLLAAELARPLGVNVLALTGDGGGLLSTMSTVTIRAPEHDTYLVQELHLPIYHCLCAEVEERIFGEK